MASTRLDDTELPHGAAREDQVSLWRGRYVEEFATAEMTLSEALVALSEIASSGTRSLLPHLVGQRFEAMRLVVDAGGPLGSVGARVARALDDFREHHRYRSYLCHGSGQSSFGGAEHWRLTLRLTTFRSGVVERTSVEIDEAEAERLLADLRSARLRLDGQLRGMLASLGR